MKNFWEKLPIPFFALAPMEDVTDFVFREIVATELGRPNVFFTEFVSADGLCSKGFEKVSQKLKYSENQRPIVAQIWGNDPEKIRIASKIASDMGFDGVDLNMGCPERNLVKRGYCSGLINNPILAGEIIAACKSGAGSIPVSVKTRIGIRKIVTEEWIAHLLKQGIQALTIHGRISTQMSNGAANWEEIGKGVGLRNEMGLGTVIVGNGDVRSISDGKEKSEKFGVDGVMMGRGIFHNPWVFSSKSGNPLDVLIKHAYLFEKTWGKKKNFAIMKKFFKMYVNNFDGAFLLRMKLMETKNAEEVHLETKRFLDENKMNPVFLDLALNDQNLARESTP